MTDRVYAHIFKARAGFELYITETPSLVGAIREGVYLDRAAAKARAAELGAKPWNYR